MHVKQIDVPSRPVNSGGFSSFKSQIVNIIDSGNVQELKGLLDSAPSQAIGLVKDDVNLKLGIKKGLEKHNKTIKGIDMALICYRKGLGFEPNINDPITTNTIIYTAQELDTFKAIELNTLALENGVKVNSITTRNTLVDAGYDLSTVDKISNMIRLAKVATNFLDLKDPKVVGVFNVILAKLGDPTDGRDLEKKDIFFISERIDRGLDLIEELLQKGIRFNEDDEEIKGRINNYIRGTRTVAEELFHSIDEPLVYDLFKVIGLNTEDEDKINEESLKLMKDAFRLMAECIGKFQIKGETVNSSFSSLFTNKIPLDDELLKLVDDTFQRAIDFKQIRIHLNSTTMNVLLKYILDSNCKDKFNVADGMIHKASQFGYKFHDEIISRIHEGMGAEHALISLNSVSKHKQKVVEVKQNLPEEMNGLVPLSIMKKYFPDYEPDKYSLNAKSRLKGGLGTVTSYLN